MRTFLTGTVLLLVGGLALPAATSATDIVHDAEFYVLKSQNEARWAAEDEALEARLAALRKKHGTSPNIV
jgi:arylsulfatase